tara:strand:+ start:1983 stop:2519 length:537 start_codon:yes stop_codon:yes gene_type:complete
MALPTTDERGQLDMFSAAPPGISLTQDNTKYPWGNPPKHSDPNDAMDAAVTSLGDPTIKDNMLKLLFAGVSVESLIEGFIYSGFESGKFSLDTGLLMKGPLGLYIASIAEDEGIPYRLFENENAFEKEELDDEHVLRIMKMNNPSMFKLLQQRTREAIREGKKIPDDESFIDQERSAE